MKRDEIDALRALVGKATPGPWTQWVGNAAVYSNVDPGENCPYAISGKGMRQIADTDQEVFDDGDVNNGINNASFIAAANPAMIAHLLACEQHLRALVRDIDREAVLCDTVMTQAVAEELMAVGDRIEASLQAARALTGDHDDQ